MIPPSQVECVMALFELYVVVFVLKDLNLREELGKRFQLTPDEMDLNSTHDLKSDYSSRI